MSRYAAAHETPQGPGDARPTALQIVKDEGAEGKLEGKVIVITGTSSGIGIETVRALSATGARLFLTARDLEKAKTALDGIFDASRMELVQMDQASLESVRAAAKQILNKTDNINILVENAGIMAVPDLQFTKDGHELQFGTNHLSHFLLFELLKPALLKAVTPELNSRVVVLASSGHHSGGINDSDNYNFQKSDYNPFIAYAQSKTANIYMANELDRRYGSQGLHATSVHPGGILTALSRYMADEQVQAVISSDAAKKSLKSPEQGAATSVWAAIGKHWENAGGKYLQDCEEAPFCANPASHFGKGYVKHAYDPELEARLWEDSLKIVGLA
ncbi:hypothetical protein FSARC_450 [Fusarium sarcochroum]|uniref:Reductase n=1 Tax=Fusarium sarcochroum TaxID=1208366 RepID=A0A8H4UB57_9HYPO|nr:hypothetical protein FSARC_450 [Fusarium sarcochroum]